MGYIIRKNGKKLNNLFKIKINYWNKYKDIISNIIRNLFNKVKKKNSIL